MTRPRRLTALGLLTAMLVASVTSAHAGIGEAGTSGEAVRLPGSHYREVILGDRPAGYWRLSEVPGSSYVVDESGNDRHGSYAGKPRLGTRGALVGDFNTAPSFDGVDDQASMPSVLTPGRARGTSRRPRPFSLELWVRPDPPSERTDRTLYLSLAGYDYTSRLLWQVSDRRLVSQFGRLFVSTRPVSADRWTYVVYTFDGSTQRFYIDALPAGAGRAKRPAWDSPFTLGAFGASSYYRFKGELDELAVYGRALTPAEIREHLAASLREGLTRDVRRSQQGLLYVATSLVLAYLLWPLWWVALLWGLFGLAGLAVAPDMRWPFVTAAIVLVLAAVVRRTQGRHARSDDSPAVAP